MAPSWMWSIQMPHAAFVAIAEINILEKNGWAGQDECDGQP